MDILTSLQIAGALLSGVGGVLATFTDTRTEDKRRLTASGWWAISLTLGGISLALVSQKLANDETSEQMSGLMSNTTNVLQQVQGQNVKITSVLTNLNVEAGRSQKSLSYIERMVLRLERLEFTTEYQLETNTEALSALRYQVKAITDSMPPGVSRVFPISLGEVFDSLKGPQTAGGANTSAASLSSQLAELQGFLSSPGLKIRLFSAFTPRIDVYSIDFDAAFKPGEYQPSFEYMPAKDRVKVVWKYIMTASDWQATERMASAQDLANAELFMNPLNCPASLRPQISPLSVTLDFEKARITVTNFTKSIILGAAAGPRPMYDDDVAHLPSNDIVINSALWETKRPVRPSPPILRIIGSQ